MSPENSDRRVVGQPFRALTKEPMARAYKIIVLNVFLSTILKEKRTADAEAGIQSRNSSSSVRSELYCRMMFSQAILEHFQRPHNTGEILDATATVSVTNPVCGDTLQLSVRLAGGRIEEARFKTQGCVAAIAASSVLTDLLTGKTIEEARQVTAQQISEELQGLPPATFHAAQLCVDAVGALLKTV